MKVLFLINVEDLGFEEPLGVLYLSAAAKAAGHEVYATDENPRQIIKKIDELKPDLLSISVLTPSFSYMYDVLEEVKRARDVPALMGGPHPTYFPQVVEREAIDYVMRGECEHTFVELLGALENKKPLSEVKNLTYMEGGSVVHNPLAPLIEDLDTVSFPDRGLLEDYPQFTKADLRSVMASRGCPYQCSYCFNHEYQALYKDLGKKLRFRSVDNVVAECKELKEKHGTRMIHFFDDIFPFKSAWIEEFAEKYTKEVGLPYITNTSFNLLSDHYVDRLAHSGCKCLLIGVETGNEKLREEVLFRKMKNSMMIERAELLHSRDIKIYTQNLLGIPRGSLAHDLETLQLNIDLKADYAGGYLCQPYPGTPIERIAREEGIIESDKDFGRSFYYSSKLRIEDRDKVEKLRVLFPIVTNNPWLMGHIDRLLEMNMRPFQIYGKLLHGWKIWRVILRYPMGPASFIKKVMIFFRRTINRMVLSEKDGLGREP